MIKNIIFDFGGVICTIDHPEAIRRFTKLGLKDAEVQLNPYTQGGIFGAIEEGKIDEEEFRIKLSEQCGRELSLDECLWGWLGYRKEVPARNIELLRSLRRRGYRLIMLSNTNPYMMAWAMSPDFSKYLDVEEPKGLPASSYFDSVYLSCELGVMKPDVKFFEHVIKSENIIPEESLFIDDGPRNVSSASKLGLKTLQPDNGSDWTIALEDILSSND